ncbi:MAG: hypothetical protein Q8P86_03840 [bacterium]|nr:hypothetical protein [bacterium]
MPKTGISQSTDIKKTSSAKADEVFFKNYAVGSSPSTGVAGVAPSSGVPAGFCVSSMVF